MGASRRIADLFQFARPALEQELAVLAEQFELEATEGLVVTEVERGSVAARKGIAVGDIITAVNHKNVTTPKQFNDALKSAESKKGVILDFISKGVKKFEVLKDGGE